MKNKKLKWVLQLSWFVFAFWNFLTNRYILLLAIRCFHWFVLLYNFNEIVFSYFKIIHFSYFDLLFNFWPLTTGQVLANYKIYNIRSKNLGHSLISAEKQISLHYFNFVIILKNKVIGYIKKSIFFPLTMFSSSRTLLQVY